MKTMFAQPAPKDSGKIAVVLKHALRNALLPIVTVIGLEFAFLIGGLVVTEQVFNLNGIGMLLVESITHRDYTMTQALVLLVSCAFIAMNFFSTCSMSGSTRESIISETSQRRGRR